MSEYFKGKEAYEKEMDELRKNYTNWKNEMRDNKAPFFLIYKSFQHEHLRDISGGALKLYLYLGFHANNFTGECWHSVESIADYFGNDKRTIQKWFKELEELNLITRIQKGYKWVANTFLLPYENIERKGENKENE